MHAKTKAIKIVIQHARYFVFKFFITIKGTPGWSISRILSNSLRYLGNHLSGRCVAAPLGAAYPGLTQPTGGKGAYGDEQSPIVHRRNRPCLALLPAGVTWPRTLLRAPVVSYTTFSPSRPLQWRRSLFVSVALVRQVHAFRQSSRQRMTDFPAPGAIRRRAL
ncbi:MAG: hypothetical protein RL275_1488 [Chloroflexota bacterium]